MKLFKFLFPLQHMKRPASQNKRVGVLWMAFRARKGFGTFEKRAPGRGLLICDICRVLEEWTHYHDSSSSLVQFESAAIVAGSHFVACNPLVVVLTTLGKDFRHIAALLEVNLWHTTTKIKLMLITKKNANTYKVNLRYSSCPNDSLVALWISIRRM